MRKESAIPDRLVAEIAGRQHGVCSAEQLVRTGLSTAGINRRLRAGRLHRVHHGVYAVGHPRLGMEGRWMAAVLACGEGAVLSHLSAAALWRVLPPAPGPVHVTVHGPGGRRKRRAITVHRSRTLTPAVVTRRLNIPATCPTRTLADLRRQVDGATLREARRQASVIGLLIARESDDRTRSELEYRFLGLCRRYRLTRPEVNAKVGPFIVDFLWRRQRLIVETDGYRYHRGRESFEADRNRDLHLRVHGYEVLRFSYRQVIDDSRAVATAIRLKLRGGRPPRRDV